MIRDPEELLADLNEEQRQAVAAQQGPVLITAGPGSGKTRTVTRRIAYGVHTGSMDPVRTMALTFTTRAAGELHRRLAELGAGGVTARTFHSAALRQLRHFWPEIIGGEPAAVVAYRGPLLQAAAEAEGLTAIPGTLLGTELDWMKARGIAAADYAASAGGRRLAGIDPGDVARVAAAYEQVKSQRGVIDFDDVLLLTIAILDSRTDAREKVRRQYRWFTVDEYQDVSPLQQRLLDLWLGERRSICVVGDPAQSIYAFAGADPGLIASFPRRYQGVAVVSLPVTYRCAPKIAAAANSLATAIPHATHLRSERQGDAGAIQILKYPGDGAEAEGVAEEIAALVRGGDDPGQVAVLYRVNQQAQRIRDALGARRIPYAVRSSERFFDRPEVREAITRTRGHLRTDPGSSAAEAWSAVTTAMGHEQIPPDSGSGRDRWESLAALELIAQRLDSGAELLAEFDRRAADKDPPPAAGVSLMTLHAAKGLEWDSVFIIGAWDGMMPLAAADDEEQLAEELRLAYVGVTRPRRRLMITWGEYGGRGGRRTASPYLASLAPTRAAAPQQAMLPEAPPQSAVDSSLAGQLLPPARCRLCGRSLVTGRERVLGRCRICPTQHDELLLARLQRWRCGEAESAGMPDYAVMTSATLEAVAEIKPRTRADLAAIPGMTDERLQRYGAELLGLVAAAS